jgi:hypothetical protein
VEGNILTGRTGSRLDRLNPMDDVEKVRATPTRNIGKGTEQFIESSCRARV